MQVYLHTGSCVLDYSYGLEAVIAVRYKAQQVCSSGDLHRYLLLAAQLLDCACLLLCSVDALGCKILCRLPNT